MKIKINKEQIAYLNSLETRELKKEFLLDHILLMLEASFDKKAEPVIFKDGKFIPKDQNLARHLAEFSKHNILYKEETNKRNYTIGEIVDKVSELSIDKIEKENLLHFDLPKNKPENLKININDLENGSFIQKTEGTTTFYDSNGPIKLFSESISKEQLKDITKPIEVDGVKHFFTTPYVIGFNTSRESSKEEFFEEVDRMKKHFDHNLIKEFVDYKPPHPDDVKRYSKNDLQTIYRKSRLKQFNGLFFYKTLEEVLEVFKKIYPSK